MKRTTTLIGAGLLLAIPAFAGDDGKKSVQPPSSEEPWKFRLSVPGFMLGIDGDVGLHGINSSVGVGFDDIYRKIDFVAATRLEARKGRVGLNGELLYLSMSDGIGTPGAVNKVDIRVDQYIGDFGLSYRLLEGRRGYLDLIAGVRYVNLYQEVGLQPDDEEIDAASRRLVDNVSDRIRERLLDVISEGKFQSALGNAIASRVTDRLANLEGFGERPTNLPAGPVAGEDPGLVRRLLRRVIEKHRDEIEAAVRGKVQVAAAAAKSALALKTAAAKAKASAALADLRNEVNRRVEGKKRELQARIADRLHDKLDRRVSRGDDWWDPYIGLRGRWNLSERWYLSGKADIGGFGIGSDLTWQAEAGVGVDLTKSIFAELGYRALSMDYEDRGLKYDVIIHGLQLTMGLKF